MPTKDDGFAQYELASPSLLADQPPTLSEDDTAPGKNWTEIYEYLTRRLNALREWRYTWWANWSELAEFLLPRLYHWVITANTYDKGVRKNQRIIDSTAIFSIRTCAAGMWSGLTPSTRPWFKMGIGIDGMDLAKESKEWLENAERIIYFVIGQSNFYSTMHQLFQNVTTFGTSPMIIYEDSQNLIRCYLPCAGEYFLACGSTFSCESFYREFVLTIAQIVEMFTLENCPEVVRNKWRDKQTEIEMVVCHAIEPNFCLGSTGGKDNIRVVPGSFPFRELYWLKGQYTEAELSRRGFHEIPFVVARWYTVSNNPYGESPGMDVIGDVKQLQQETLRKAEFLEKGVRPPMTADVQLKNEPSSIQPGHITYVTTDGTKKKFEPAFEVSPAWMGPITEDIKEIQGRIEKCFFVDLFMAITNMQGVQPRNELELTKRDLERLQGLGPVIELFETEVAAPAIKRILGILMHMVGPLTQPAVAA